MRLSKKIAQILVNNDPTLLKYLMRDGTMVVRLLRALYGLKSASLEWYNLLSDTLRKHGFERSSMDTCLFIKRIGEDVCYVLVYVDDLLVCSSSEKLEKGVRDMLIQEFRDITEKDMSSGSLSFLGMQIIDEPNGDITVNQAGYVAEVVKECKLNDASDLPTGVDFMLSNDEDDAIGDSEQFRSVLMKIMYLAVSTRVDILFPVVVLASRMSKPKVNDMKRLWKIIKYLNTTKELGLRFSGDGEINVECYVDAAFNCHPDARGHTGYCIYPDTLCNGARSAPVVARSIKQKSVADSSTEAELIALHEAMQHLNWVIDVYEDMGYNLAPVTVYQDNKAAITLSSSEPVNFRGRSKYINRKYFSVHEHVASGRIQLVYCGTDDMVADFLTKSLMGAKFRKFRIALMGFADYSYSSKVLSTDIDR